MLDYINSIYTLKEHFSSVTARNLLIEELKMRIDAFSYSGPSSPIVVASLYLNSNNTMEDGFRQLAIGTSQNYPTQYSEDLPVELGGVAAIRQLDSLTVRNFKSFRKRHLLFRKGTLYWPILEIHKCGWT